MPRHGRPGETQQAGHLGACLPPVVSTTASGFTWSQITWMSPTQLPTALVTSPFLGGTASTLPVRGSTLF